MKQHENDFLYIKQYLPMILKNEKYFKSYVEYLLKVYNFQVNEENLRRKLHKFLDNPSLGYRLIRGVSCEDGQMNWMWLDSRDVGIIAKRIM